MAYASQQYVKNLLGQTLKAAQEGGLLGGGGTVEGSLYYGIDRYSEDEICIGEYMGKPLYRKCFNIKTPTVSSSGGVVSTEQLSNIDDLDTIINIHGTFLLNGTYRPIGFYGNQLAGGYIPGIRGHYDITTKKVIILNSSATYNNCPCIVIIEYTKTTDANNSFNPAMITNNLTVAGAAYDDYNEDEVVIGRWVDGRPIYRKVNASKEISIPRLTGYDSHLIYSSEYTQSASNQWYGPAWRAFDGNKTNFYTPGSTSAYIGWDFEIPIIPKKIEFTSFIYNNTARVGKIILQGSNNNTLWNDIQTYSYGTHFFISPATALLDVNTSSSYRYLRLSLTGQGGDAIVSDIDIKGVYYLDNTDLDIDIKINNKTLDNYIITEYTKTTDTPNSFTPSMVLGGVSNETASDADVEEVFT